MSNPKDFKFSLKVLINKQKTKVLYAEADSDFTDVLLSFLTLPLGTIVRVLKKQYGDDAPVFGSLTTLYNGSANLDNDLFWAEYGKQMLLNPISSSEFKCRKLKINVDDTNPTKYFKCNDINCSFKKFSNVSMHYSTLKCDCGKRLSKEMFIRDIKTGGSDDGDGGVYIRSKASFIITDDLQVLPSVTGCAIRILSSLGIRDAGGTELRNVTFGFTEIMDLLKGSLLSRTPLTELILNKKQTDCVTVKCETGALLSDQIEKQKTSNTMTMTVKAIFQDSTNKILFVEADDDFIDFLFSLLTIPLGRVECLLGGSTCFKNIDNLYRSMADINGAKYLKTNDTKALLLKPMLPFCYNSKKQILPLTEEKAPDLYFHEDFSRGYLSPSYQVDRSYGVSVSSIKLPEGAGNYVKGPTMYMVTDDLTVTPLCSASGLSILNSLKIPLSDVKELELVIGLEEALSILKASLTSTCPLTDGLINPILKKQPKKEH